MSRTRERNSRLILLLTLLVVNAGILALSADFVPRLDDITRPLTPDNHSYLALCRGQIAGIEEPFRFRPLAPFLARLAGDCTRGFVLLNFLCTSGAAFFIALMARRITRSLGLGLLGGTIYLLIFCPRANEAPWLTDSLASFASAFALTATTSKFGRYGRLATAAAAAISGLGRELLPLLFLKVRVLVAAWRARILPPASAYLPALLGLAIYLAATRIIGPQLGELDEYLADYLVDPPALAHPLRYGQGLVHALSFLWPFGIFWLLGPAPPSGAAFRLRLQSQALWLIGLSLFQTLLGGDTARLFRLFTLPVFIIAALDVATNYVVVSWRSILGAGLGFAACALALALVLLQGPPLDFALDVLTALGSLALAGAALTSHSNLR